MGKTDYSQILNSKPTRQCEWREYKKGSLLENGLALNEMATFIWKLCEGKKTVKEMVELICDQYDVSHQIAETETIDCVRELLNEGAIKLK